MLRLWNRSPNTASAKKNGGRARSDNAKHQETFVDTVGEKENGTTKHLESHQITGPNQENTRSTGTDSLLELCNHSAPAVSHESVSDPPGPPCVTTAKTTTATQTTDDRYDWAYEVWRDMGLMGSKKKTVRQTTLLVESRLISDIIGGIEDRVSQQHQEKQEELRKQQELQQKKMEKERREQRMAVITPKGPSFPNTFSEHAHRRMSLPSQFTQKKQQGRKSFANILQQWREKSDDKPNTHFLSPGQLSPLRSSRSTSQDVHKNAHTMDEFSSKRIHDASSLRTREPTADHDDHSESVTQASKIRAQYFQSRRDTQVSSRGRVRPQPSETSHDGPGRNIRRTRSVSRSRGDFRTAVQQVLESVDAAQSLSRSKSALFANTMADQDHQVNGRDNGIRLARAELDIVLSPRELNTKSRGDTRFQRSKSAPRSIDRNMVTRMTDADRQSSGLFYSSSERDAKSNKGNTLRMTDFMNLTADAKMFNSDDNCSIPSHVEIDEDDHYSVADSKLTDMRTECESLGPSPAKTPYDSPWTKNVALKLNRVQQGKGSGSREGRPWHHDIIINRVGSMSDSRFPVDGECFCSSGVFAGKDDLIDFFLPLMGTGCTCGKYSNGLRNPEEPTSLENILRPWQVDFLTGFGIYRGDEMVKAHHRSGSALATALRQYQKKKGISSYRTKSCAMALEIWAKTCKAFVRSIRKQLTEGTVELKLPNTLYILSSFLEKLPVSGTDLNMSSNSSIASGAWSVTHSQAPLALRQYEAVGMKYVTRSGSSDVSEV